jgi:GAF domain-containing protein
MVRGGGIRGRKLARDRAGAGETVWTENKRMFEAGKLVLDLQTMRDDGHLSDALMRYAVRTVASSDERYSWVGVFLVDSEGGELWLHNYIGSPTEHAKIPVGTGVSGRAVAEKANLNVPDITKEEGEVTSSEDALSEMVVLIRAGDEIFGAIDLESEEEGSFTEEDEFSVQAVADKLAEQLAAERR